MAEIMVVIVVMGILALIAVPIYNNVRGAGLDTVKAKNATTLNQLMTTIHNAGVDTTVWTTSTAAIAALRAGVTLPTVTPRAQAQQILLQDDLNPDAYKFTAGTATTAPIFEPILNQPTVRP
jgi:Tfp pilus assembly protein PilE